MAHEGCFHLALALAVVLLPAFGIAACERTRALGFAIAALTAGASLGCVQAGCVHSYAQIYADASGCTFTFELAEDSRNSGYGESALARGSAEGLPEATFTVIVDSDEPLLCGERITGTAKVSAVDYAVDEYGWRSGASGRLVVGNCKREQQAGPLGALRAFRAKAIDMLGGDDEASALLQAVVCGYRRNMTGTECYAEFQTCGIAHLVAVSGAHLVIVTGIMASLLRFLNVSRRATIVVLIAIMASYYVIAGMPVSALRASIMSGLGLTAYFGKRRASSINSVGIGAFAMIAANPLASVSASFALSTLATTGIVLFGPLFQSWIDETPIGRCAPLAESLALTAAASVLSQPYACSLFNLLPLMSPVANALCAPFFPVICTLGLGSALMSIISAPAGNALAFLAQAVGIAFECIVSACASLPFSAVPVYLGAVPAFLLTAAVGVGLWVAWPVRITRQAIAVVIGACTAAVLCVILVLPQQGDRIVMLDIGQGDAILVQSRGQTLLIDTGNHDSELIGGLARNGVVKIDSVLITHADDDHCGSLDALRQAVVVDRVLIAAGLADCQDESVRDLIAEAEMTAPEVIGVNAGDRFRVGAFDIHVIWPHSITDEGGNPDSICLAIEYDGDDDGVVDCTALMTGDAEHEELVQMIGAGDVGSVDILKVGHHGSKNGMTQEEAQELSPHIALISCGLGNRYGHPAPETLELLASVQAQIYRTDLDGQITCSLSPGRIVVSTQDG